MERHRVGSSDPPQRRNARRRAAGHLGRFAQGDLRHDSSRIENRERRLFQLQFVSRIVLYAQYDLGPRQPLPPGFLDRFEPDVSLRLLGRPAAGAQRQYRREQQYVKQHPPENPPPFPGTGRSLFRRIGPEAKRIHGHAPARHGRTGTDRFRRCTPARRSGTGTDRHCRYVPARTRNPAAEYTIRGRTARSYAFYVHRHFCPV